MSQRTCRDFAQVFRELSDSLTEWVFEATLSEWTTTQECSPGCSTCAHLGQLGDINIETTGVAFTEHDVSDADFSTDVTACLSELG